MAVFSFKRIPGCRASALIKGFGCFKEALSVSASTVGIASGFLGVSASRVLGFLLKGSWTSCGKKVVCCRV